MKRQQEHRLPAWAVILLVIFYPFGLIYLIYRFTSRLSTAPENFKKNSKSVQITAYVLIIFGIIYLIAGVTGNLETNDQNDVFWGVVVALLIFCGSGIAMLRYCKKCERHAKLYEKYVRCILGSRIENINQLASIVGTDYDTAVKDLEKLVGYGALKNAYIDHQYRKIILPDLQGTAPPTVTVICPHCGGSSQIPEGQTALCDYCNMPLK